MEDLYNTHKDDIKSPYYLNPTQVRFAQINEDGTWNEDYWGVAFQDTIICFHCGSPVCIDDDVIVLEEIKNWVPCEEVFEI